MNSVVRATRSVAVLLLLVASFLVWWLNWSPQAHACFTRGGTTFNLDGRCFRVIVTESVVQL